MDNNTSEEWFTVEEAAAHLKLSIPTIRKYISQVEGKAPKLPHYRQGRIIRFKKADLDNFLQKAA